MNLIIIEKLPEHANARHNLQRLIDDFVDSESKFALVEFTGKEYKTIKVGYTCLANAVKRSKHPIKVKIIGNNIYLVKGSGN